MDIWHTAEPNVVATEGWLGRVTRELDPDGENPVTTVNFGQGLPRALLADGVSAASVSDSVRLRHAHGRGAEGQAHADAPAVR